jgi:hypothetical protein
MVPGEEGREGKMEEVRRRDQQAGCGAGRGGLGLSEVGALAPWDFMRHLNFIPFLSSLFIDIALHS